MDNKGYCLLITGVLVSATTPETEINIRLTPHLKMEAEQDTATVDTGGPYPYGTGMNTSLEMYVTITSPSWLNSLKKLNMKVCSCTTERVDLSSLQTLRRLMKELALEHVATAQETCSVRHSTQ
jgi:hypothetical protein